VLHNLQLASPPDDCGNATTTISGNSTGLVSYPNMLRALGLSRYVADRLRREQRFRIVASGKALFVPAVDVERLRVYLSEQDEANEARDAVATLPWFERAQTHRLPIALRRQSARTAVCGAHLHKRVRDRVGETVCEVSWVASLALRLRLARSGEVCADRRNAPIRDAPSLIIGGVDVADFTGDRSRSVCVAHICDALAQAANEALTGQVGKFISVRGVIEVFERLHVGNGYEFCNVCMTNAGEALIRKRIASPAHHYNFISRNPTRAATPTLRALP
jgi:hypothetical protein